MNDPNLYRTSFITYVTKKIKRMIHHLHVFSVLHILFDEMIEDFKNDKEINIHNFGKFEILKTKPRKHFNIVEQKVVLSKSYCLIKFKLNNNIKKILVDNLKRD